MARPRLPTAIHEAKGSFIKDPQRRRPAEPKTSGDLGDAPAHLSDEQRVCWTEIRTIAPLRVLTSADRWLAEISSRLMADLRTQGDLSAMKLALLLNCLGRIGMTPADRAKIAVAPEEKEDASPWGALTVIPGGKKTA